jgi:hypothetical protein
MAKVYPLNGVMRPADDAAPDAEGRFPWEPMGFTTFAFKPKRCRNGKLRWLCFVERHGDGSYTYAHSQSFGG